MTLTEKIIKNHLVDGDMVAGQLIGLKIDQTLTQDSTGTMAYLQLEAMGIKTVKTNRSVAYIDHNMLQEGFENPDDHKYIQTVAHRHGIYFSRPGNGVCHQVHVERFSVPGSTLLGSDSHTPTCGGVGMLAIGAGGLDVAVAMGGGAYYITMPEVVNIELSGKLSPFVTAKDVILEVLRLLTVKGGVGRVFEYTGEGVKTLTVPQRATITNMGAELGATTSIFPSDESTKAFLEAQGRVADYTELSADKGAVYADTIRIDLCKLEPLCAAPHSPDNVIKVADVGEVKIDQVAIGSCTNGSYSDLMNVATILKGKTVHPDVSLVVSPGSRQVLTMLSENGALADIISAGARILENSCGPCIGMGQAPASNAISLRTFNRNFKGRCGTESAQVYLVSPETAAISAITGYLTDPRQCNTRTITNHPTDTNVGAITNHPTDTNVGAITNRPTDTNVGAITKYPYIEINDNMIIPPSSNPEHVEVVRGPNIKPFPLGAPPEDIIAKKVLIKLEDNITTDHIMPSGAKLLPYRSNIPHLALFCLTPCDADFPSRAVKNGGGIIIAGENYGQGSSREHAALVPLYLGIKAVIAKSFARIHKANLINSGIIPLTFNDPNDYNKLNVLDELVIEDVVTQLKNKDMVTVSHGNNKIETSFNVSNKELETILAGGKINLYKQ